MFPQGAIVEAAGVVYLEHLPLEFINGKRPHDVDVAIVKHGVKVGPHSRVSEPGEGSEVIVSAVVAGHKTRSGGSGSPPGFRFRGRNPNVPEVAQSIRERASKAIAEQLRP